MIGMSNKNLKKFEKVLWIVFITVGFAGVFSFVLLCREGKLQKRPAENVSRQPETEQNESGTGVESGLSDKTMWLPEGCGLYESLPEIYFENENGVKYSSRDFNGKKTVLVFWASWCEDCREQMPHMKEFMEFSKNFGDIQFLFINRLDGTRETKENAAAYFQELGLDAPVYFDVGETAYQALGMKNIPTTYFLDEEGKIITWSAGQITEKSVFEAYLNNLCKGNRQATQDFVINALTDEEGGIHTTYVPGDTAATLASQVLSESQGILMEYAVRTGQKELFDRTWNYVRGNMNLGGLISWCITEGTASGVNALLDDLRIYRALREAEKLWGGYAGDAAGIGGAIAAYAVQDGCYVDFYDTKNGQAAGILTLCYIDLETMELLAGTYDVLREAYENAAEILQYGQISETFPLFYTRYNYKTKSYEKDDLHMAEAMVTLLHMAKAGILPENTHDWLRKQMEYGSIMAKYTVDGEPVEGYQYESTAVYALTAMIGDTLGDAGLRGWALKKMEKSRIQDCSRVYNGAFGNEDGSGIVSFDQLMPLSAYAALETIDKD